MGAFLAAIGRFFGGIVSEVIPAIFNELRKPRRTRFGGGGKELRKDMDKSIEDQLGDKQ